MKTITKLALALACLGAVSLGSIKTASADACSGFRCNNTQIERLYPSSSGVVYIRPADGGQNNLTCDASNGGYLRLKKSHPLFDEIYKAILATVLAKGEMSFRVNEDSAPCEILYITMSGK